MYELRQWLKERTHKESPWGDVCDTNGYSQSIYQTESGTCCVCRSQGDTVRHEIFYGTADRKTSKAVGCWLYLCPSCHAKAHKCGDFDYGLKVSAQRLFESKHSDPHNAQSTVEAHEMFMTLFGKNYLL